MKVSQESTKRSNGLIEAAVAHAERDDDTAFAIGIRLLRAKQLRRPDVKAKLESIAEAKRSGVWQ
jgi:hypothetical protein